jgi:nucleoside-diphosphate-sugar epimerase
MSNAVVAGGYTLIGRHLVSALLQRGESIAVVDFAKETRRPFERARVTLWYPEGSTK